MSSSFVTPKTEVFSFLLLSKVVVSSSELIISVILSDFLPIILSSSESDYSEFSSEGGFLDFLDFFVDFFLLVSLFLLVKSESESE